MGHGVFVSVSTRYISAMSGRYAKFTFCLVHVTKSFVKDFSYFHDH